MQNNNTSLVVLNGNNVQNLVSPKGKVMGQRMTFAQTMTASQLRKSLKASGMKGAELTQKVNEVITGAKDLRWAECEVLVSALRSQGAIPDHGDVRKKSATLSFVIPQADSAPKAAKVAELSADDKDSIGAAQLGMTLEQFRQLKNAKRVDAVAEVTTK